MYQTNTIVLTINYTSLIREQSSLVKRGRRSLMSYFRVPIVNLILFVGRFFVVRVNEILARQLLICKGVLSTLPQDLEEVKGTDLSKLITAINALNMQNIKFHGEITTLLKSGAGKHVEGICNTEKLLEEIIEVQYDISRLLKKANKIIPMDTSELAKSISAHSFENLQKVTYGR